MEDRRPLTEHEWLVIGDRRRITARELAEARQRIAHEGTGYVPPWGDLTPDEQNGSTMEAAGWLRALGILLYDGVATGARLLTCGCPEWNDDGHAVGPGCPAWKE